MTARPYTGPWPIRSHRTLADLPAPPEPQTAAFEVLPPVYTGPLPPAEDDSKPMPLPYLLLIGFAGLYLALVLVGAAMRWAA